MSARKPSAAPVVDLLADFPWLDFGHAVVHFETGQIVTMSREEHERAADNGRETSDEGSPCPRVPECIP